MIEPNIPKNEVERLEELKAYQILDTLPEEDFDNLTKIASEICETNISLVSLVDDKRQWFKSRFGLDATETPREYAFCAHAINQPNEMLVVNDARRDERFSDNPLVVGEPFVTFYAGVPLVGEKGNAIGTLCVIDDHPKSLSNRQREALNALSKQIMNLIELRKKRTDLEETIKTLEMSNDELERFAGLVAHDVRGPLSSINGLVQLFRKEHFLNEKSEEAKHIFNLIVSASDQLRMLIDRLLNYTRTVHVHELKSESIKIADLEVYLKALYPQSDRLAFNFDLNSIVSINVNRSVVERILLNLVNNSIKYNDKEKTIIDISFMEDDNNYIISIQDNGPGIELKDQERIFEIFNVLNKKSTVEGTGMGLAIVKKLVNSIHGTIEVQSPEVGVRFVVKFPNVK